MKADAALAKLRALGDPANVEGMARFGINPQGTLGVSVPAIRSTAKDIRRELKGEPDRGASARHALAAELWDSGVHEARMLAALIDEPGLVTGDQMERWVADLDSWDVCDGVCANLFDKTDVAYAKAVEWAGREPEFQRRAGFALMAALAWHDKDAPDERFEPFLPLIEHAATDDRNFVKKAVNWALRQIGKRSAGLNAHAIETAERIAAMDSKAARWIARDALAELRSDAVRGRLGL